MSAKCLFAFLSAACVLFAAQASFAATCLPVWDKVSSPGYSTGEDQILDLSVLSDTDVWAVGMSDNGGFVQHWDGTSWSTRLGPVGTDYYYGIAATGSDVWVVGFRYDSVTGYQRTLVKRWDGVSWSTVATPTVPGSTDNAFEAVVALSPADVWAVGEYSDPTLDSFHSQPLIQHWNGTAWSISPTPDLSGNANVFLQAVTASGPGDVWALGRYMNAGIEQTLALHWNGAAWTQQTSANPSSERQMFSGGSAIAGDAWAVGFSGDLHHDPLIEHSSGAGFSTVASPGYTAQAELNGVAALSADDVWAVGNISSGGGRTLAEHWDGGAWSLFPSPQIAGDLERFNAVATTPGGNLWAAGARNSYLATLIERLCPIKVRDSGYSLPAAEVPQGSTVAWSFPSYDVGDHSVTDGTGMGLFDSGPRTPGGSFNAQFIGAGTYAIQDTESSNTSEIEVPVTAAGAPGLHADVTWATANADPGFVYDVQVKRPGTATFVAWRTGVTARSGTYTASTAGNYRFRARLRKPGVAATDWSPVTVFFIS